MSQCGKEKSFFIDIMSRIQTRPGILGAIGNTPLVEMPFETKGGKIFGKMEYLNPGGSVKDRSALYMIEEAERQGILKPGGTIIEASSGNQGIAVAMIGAVKGYKVIVTVSEAISPEKLKTIRAYGAEVITCPSNTTIKDAENYRNHARTLQKLTPNSFFPNQYFNLWNPQAHYLDLGPEIWRQTEGKITHFFVAAGTGGTVSGVGRFLKEQNPKIKIIAVDVAASFHATNGDPKPYRLEGIGIDFETPCLNESVVDEFINVTDDDALAMMQTMARQYGFLVGTSSGAVSYAVHSYKDKLTKDDYAVMILPDSGRAYLFTKYWSEAALVTTKMVIG